jgi:hypothetical protein
MIMDTKKIGKMIDLVFRAVAVAMAVAAVVLNILAVVPAQTQILFLGIGLFCLAVTALDSRSI